MSRMLLSRSSLIKTRILSLAEAKITLGTWSRSRSITHHLSKTPVARQWNPVRERSLTISLSHLELSHSDVSPLNKNSHRLGVDKLTLMSSKSRKSFMETQMPGRSKKTSKTCKETCQKLTSFRVHKRLTAEPLSSNNLECNRTPCNSSRCSSNNNSNSDRIHLLNSKERCHSNLWRSNKCSKCSHSQATRVSTSRICNLKHNHHLSKPRLSCTQINQKHPLKILWTIPLRTTIFKMEGLKANHSGLKLYSCMRATTRIRHSIQMDLVSLWASWMVLPIWQLSKTGHLSK